MQRAHRGLIFLLIVVLLALVPIGASAQTEGDVNRAEDQVDRAKLLYLNYPNNPTGAVYTAESLDRLGELRSIAEDLGEGLNEQGLREPWHADEEGEGRRRVWVAYSQDDGHHFGRGHLLTNGVVIMCQAR